MSIVRATFIFAKKQEMMRIVKNYSRGPINWVKRLRAYISHNNNKACMLILTQY